jgi:hypothetical protein
VEADAQVIGSGAVKVLPDAKDFRRVAQAELSRVETQLSGAVVTEADLAGAKRELLEGLRAINQENRNSGSAAACCSADGCGFFLRGVTSSSVVVTARHLPRRATPGGSERKHR